MTPEAARDAIITKVAAVLAASLPTLPAFYENVGKIPFSSLPGDMLVYVSVDFMGAVQASMEKSPIVRYTGEVCLLHMQRDGTGTKAMTARADTLNSELKFFSSGTMQMAVPRPGRKEAHDGWISQEWRVPFWLHQ